MTSIRASLARLVVGSALLLLAETGRAEGPPEPEGYRLDNYRSPTPGTLKGVRVLDTEQAAVLWKAGSAVFVDVLPQPPKPANLPPGTIWRDPPHDSVPAAVWLPNTGYGALSAEAESYFRRGLEVTVKGDLDKPVVFFCQRSCWMSWNAAKRALEYGYRQVSWFPDGTDGWAEAGLPLQPIEPTR